MMSFILTSAQGIQLVAAQPGSGTLLGTEAGGGGALWIINKNTGIASNPVLVGGGVLAITGIATDPTNGDVYISTSAAAGDIYKINPTTGVIISGPLPTGFPQVGDLAFKSDGTLYAVMSDGIVWFIATINKNTGIASPLANPTGVVGLEAIAFGFNDVLYAVSKSALAGGTPGIPGDTLFTIDLTPGPTEGLETPIASIVDVIGIPHSGGVVGLEFGCDGKLYAGTSRNQAIGSQPQLITINPTSGVFTLTPNPTGFTFSLSDLTFDDSCNVVGGTFIPIDSTSLLLAGAQMTSSWLIPVVLSALGIGVIIVSRKSN